MFLKLLLKSSKWQSCWTCELPWSDPVANARTSSVEWKPVKNITSRRSDKEDAISDCFPTSEVTNLYETLELFANLSLSLTCFFFFLFSLTRCSKTLIYREKFCGQNCLTHQERYFNNRHVSFFFCVFFFIQKTIFLLSIFM